MGSNLFIASDSQYLVRGFLRLDDLFLHLLYDFRPWLRAKTQQQESAESSHYRIVRYLEIR